MSTRVIDILGGGGGGKGGGHLHFGEGEGGGGGSQKPFIWEGNEKKR